MSQIDNHLINREDEAFNDLDVFHLVEMALSRPRTAVGRHLTWQGTGRVRAPCPKRSLYAQSRAQKSDLSALDTTVWTGCVFRPSKGDVWDSANVGNPVVSCFVGDNEQRWFMYYTGASAIDQNEACKKLPLLGITGIATSLDGLNWTRPTIDRASREKDNVVLGRNVDEWWAFDTEAVAVSDVQIMFSKNVNSADGVYWMYYSGIGDERRQAQSDSVPEDSLRLMRPGIAMSQDGYHWARIEGKHYSGSLFEVGDADEWDALLIGRPQMLNCGKDDLRMYYHAFDPNDQKFKIGLATSKDGLDWEKQGVILTGTNSESFDAQGCASQCVAYDVDNQQFVLFYEAVDAQNVRSIGLAVSQDGLRNWDVYAKPVLTGSEVQEAWDSGAVGAPWVISMDEGRWRLYFSGSRRRTTAQWDGIGVALTDESGPIFRGICTNFARKAILLNPSSM